MCDNNNCGCGGHEHDLESCGCGCGCGHDHEEEFMTLTLEDNSEVKCSIIEIFEAGEHEYIALLPVGSDEVLLYRYVEEENEEDFELQNIETDEEFELAEEVFFSLFEEGLFEGEFFEDGEEYEYEDETDDEDDDE